MPIPIAALGALLVGMKLLKGAGQAQASKRNFERQKRAAMLSGFLQNLSGDNPNPELTRSIASGDDEFKKFFGDAFPYIQTVAKGRLPEIEQRQQYQQDVQSVINQPSSAEPSSEEVLNRTPMQHFARGQASEGLLAAIQTMTGQPAIKQPLPVQPGFEGTRLVRPPTAAERIERGALIKKAPELVVARQQSRLRQQEAVEKDKLTGARDIQKARLDILKTAADNGLQASDEPVEGFLPVKLGDGVTVYVEPPKIDPTTRSALFNETADELYGADTPDKIRDLRPEDVAAVNKKVFERNLELSSKRGAGAAAYTFEAAKSMPIGVADKEGFHLYFDTTTAQPLSSTKTRYGTVLETPTMDKFSPDTASQVERINGAAALMNTMARITAELYGPGGQFEKVGPGARIGTAWEGLVARILQTNPVLASGERTLAGFAEKLARTLSDVKGAGTEKDVVRAIQQWAQITGRPDSKAVALELTGNVFDAMENIQRNLLRNQDLKNPLLKRPQDYMAEMQERASRAKAAYKEKVRGYMAQGMTLKEADARAAQELGFTQGGR